MLHADQLNRDSFSADLMEPVRPIVDSFVLRLLGSRAFAISDFYETRQGVCRVTPPLARELAATLPEWRQGVGLVTEDVAHLLGTGEVRKRATPTPMTGRNRAARRMSSGPTSMKAEPRLGRGCSWCGRPLEGDRRTCSEECTRAVRGGQDRSAFYVAGVNRLKAMRAAGIEPVGAASRERISKRQIERQREENEWNETHPQRADQVCLGETCFRNCKESRWENSRIGPVSRSHTAHESGEARRCPMNDGGIA